MSSPPTGTVTFLFTDIEGSTKLWERDRAIMSEALARHDRILRDAVEQRGGYVFKTVGDAFCAAFATAPDALEAAISAQHAPHCRWAWCNRTPTGAHGPAHRRRRRTWRGLLRPSPKPGRTAPFCGPRRHRPSSHCPPRSWFATSCPPAWASGTWASTASRTSPALSGSSSYSARSACGFPAPGTLDARPNNLPMQPTPLVGREKEVGAVRSGCCDSGASLLTLTGPGGTGKTRLGLQVAAELLDEFADGVFFVALAPIRSRSGRPGDRRGSGGDRESGSNR